MWKRFSTMQAAVAHVATSQQHPHDVYCASVLMNGAGGFYLDGNGNPIVCTVPLIVRDVVMQKDGSVKVSFAHPDQVLTTDEAARLASVHAATVRRAVLSGDLAPAVHLSERRIGHKLSDVVSWINK